MKTIINTIVAVALLVLTATTATARSWRINSDATKGADFADINAAMSSDEVQAGDTLYLDPGCKLTSEQSITKQVTVMGTGYFNPFILTAHVGTVNIFAPGTTLEGLAIDGMTFVMAQNVTIQRCHTADIRINQSNTTNGSYCTIRQCYVAGSIYGYSSNYRGQYATIENNIIITSSNNRVIRSLSNATIRNNYICYDKSSSYQNLYYIDNSVIENNIIRNVYNNVDYCWSYVENSMLHNNVILFASAGTYFTDQIYGPTSEADVFCMEGGNDQKYRLKEGSPAAGAATDGGDCGPYGGATPYVPSGLPQGHPYYLQYGVSSRAENGKVNVNLKIQLQDE